MAKELAPIDISHFPDLVRLAEEVRTTKIPRVLRRNDEDIAVMVPLVPRRRATTRPRTKADVDAFLAAAGSWRDLIDPQGFKAHIASSRGSDRTPVDL
ncbi:MAG: hypothetical protein GEU73_04250 [Chloroflexi bacterium]|nr:hypothetical protein [Chloroflexota bacterium]